MKVESNNEVAVLEIDGITIPVQPSAEHEWTLTTAQVAHGYEVEAGTIRRHKQEHSDELVEGKHWVVQKMNTPGGMQNVTCWTKRGVVRLGFFIKSDRARRFRDLAEDLVIGHMEGRRIQTSTVEIPAEFLSNMFEIQREFLLVLREVRKDVADLKSAQAKAREDRFLGEEVGHDEISEADFHWAVWTAELARRFRGPESRRRFTVDELMMLSPPLPSDLKNPKIALGMALSRLHGERIPVSSRGDTAEWRTFRRSQGKFWVLRMVSPC